MNWISIKDKFPNDGDRVLVYADYIDIKFFKKFTDHNNYIFADDFDYVVPTGTIHNVTHWMPLPNAPEQHFHSEWGGMLKCFNSNADVIDILDGLNK